MARRRNPTPLQWTGIAVAAGAVAATAYAVTRAVLPTPKQPQPQPEAPSDRPIQPTPSPSPPADECDPLDPSTWGTGNLCAHDGVHYIRVPIPPEPSEPTPLPQYETACSATIFEDHAWPGEAHENLGESGAAALANAVVTRRPVTIRLPDGLRAIDLAIRHDHTLELDQDQIDRLADGELVQVYTSEDHYHEHAVLLQCVKTEA